MVVTRSYSEPGNGFYIRLLNEGSHELTFSSDGYYNRTISAVGVVNYQTTILDVKLVPSGTFISPVDKTLHIKVFPNPAITELRLSFFISKPRLLEFAIYNIMGQKLLRIKQEEFSMGQHNIHLNISNLPLGIFFVEIQGEGLAVRRKFVKNNH